MQLFRVVPFSGKVDRARSQQGLLEFTAVQKPEAGFEHHIEGRTPKTEHRLPET